MAEPHTRPRRTRGTSAPRRAVVLAGTLIALVLGGLVLATAADAATVAPASPVAASQATARSAPANTAQLDAVTKPAGTAEPDGGICSVPGIGDLGELLSLCDSGSGLVGDVNNICEPAVSQPEQATAGIDSLIAPPGGDAGGKTLYDNYGVAGQYWAAYGLQCSDLTSLIGNNVAGMVFDAAKSLDRVTITVYQSAAGNGILSWLQNAVNSLVKALGSAIYFPFLAPVVIIGAIWLAWQGLVRKRASRTIEGTLWMVVACAAAIWLIGAPQDFTGVGSSVSNGVTQVLNVAFAKLPASGDGNCLPVLPGDQQSVSSNFAFTSGNGLIDENANELWSVLVCKPWLAGELGTTVFGSPTGTQTVVNKYGRQLLWSQAIAANEQPTQAVVTAKQDVYVGIAKSLQTNNPAVYALFQGNQWTTRLEIGFAALFAALAAGLLVLLISLTLIILKLGWLLLLVVGPFFLLIGMHPGFGRVIALRWFEMLVGVLLKQVAVALVLSVLLYCYALIMGTADAVLPWALKILMIALVTVAVWIYRKPFTHLFSSVGYGMIGSTERAEYSYRESSTTFRRATATAAGVAGSALPGVGAYRAARWARRNQTAGAAGDSATAAGTGTAGSAAADAAAGVSVPATGGGSAADGAGGSGYGGHTMPRLRPDAPAAADDVASGGADGGSGGSGAGGSGSGGSGAGSRSRHWQDAGNRSGGSTGKAAPPLPLRPQGGNDSGGGSAGWARNSAGWTGAGAGAGAGSGAGNGGGRAPTRPATPPAAPRPSGNGAGTARPSGTGATRASTPQSGTSNRGSAPNIPAPPITRSSGSGSAQRTTGGAAGSGARSTGNGAARNTGNGAVPGNGSAASTGNPPTPSRFWRRSK
jgi:hypothetical protein